MFLPQFIFINKDFKNMVLKKKGQTFDSFETFDFFELLNERVFWNNLSSNEGAFPLIEQLIINEEFHIKHNIVWDVMLTNLHPRAYLMYQSENKFKTRVIDIASLLYKNKVKEAIELFDEICQCKNKSDLHMFINFCLSMSRIVTTVSNGEHLIEKLLNIYHHTYRDDTFIYLLFRNPNPAMEYWIDHVLEYHLNTYNLIIHLDWLSTNKNPNIVQIIQKYIERAEKFPSELFRSSNPAVIEYLKKIKPDGYDDFVLEKELQKDEIDWDLPWRTLVQYEKCVDILKLYPDKLNQLMKKYMNEFALNHRILELVCALDTVKMKENCQSFAKELAEYTLNPTRLMRLCDTYGLDLEEYMDLLGD